MSIDGGEVRSNGHAVARGRVLEAAELAEQMERQRDRIDDALEMFAENTIAHIRQERDLLKRVELPETRTSFRDRHVLIVVWGRPTVATCRRCGPTSPTCGRCSSASTAGPTRSSRRG